MSKIIEFPASKLMDLDLAKKTLSFKVKMNNYYMKDTERFDFEERYSMYTENQAIIRVLNELEEKENG